MISDTERLDFLEAQLNHGWGDGFAIQPLDSGGCYVRPWKKVNKELKWHPTIRVAIDYAIDTGRIDAAARSATDW